RGLISHESQGSVRESLSRFEKGGYRTIFKDLVAGACQQRSDGQHGEVIPSFRRLRQGIGGDNFYRTALRQTLTRRVGEDAVGTRDDNGTGTGLTQDANGTSDGSAGINHVIEQDAVLALNITDHAVGDRFISLGVGTGLVH